MALTIKERDALEILVRQYQKAGTVRGLNAFARDILGCNHDQAAKLVDYADLVLTKGWDYDSFSYVDTIPDVVITKEHEGNELNLTLKSDQVVITSFEDLVDFYNIDLKVWQPVRKKFGVWGSQDSPKISINAEFTKDEYQAANVIDREQMRKDMMEFIPDLSKVEWVMPEPSGRLLEFFLTDLHFDRAEEGIEVAREKLMTYVRRVLARGIVDGVDEAVMIFNGDLFDRDAQNGTTKGTFQRGTDYNDRTYTPIRQAIVDSISLVASHLPVRVIFNPGNHDKEKTAYLADSVWACFHTTDRVTVDLDITGFKYIEHGVTVIGTHHGDLNVKTLPLKMAQDVNLKGVQVKEWHLGHIHTSKAVIEEVGGMLIRYFRSPANRSRWEAEKFAPSLQESVAMIWDKQLGKVAEYPVQFFNQ